MRGATSKDGKLSGNRQMVDRYNDTRGKGSAGATERPHGKGGESGGAHEEGGHDEIKQIVGEHGAAHSHLITKGSGGYTSTTHHEDGTSHSQKHDSLDEAHEHGKQAMEDGEHNELDRDGESIVEGKDHHEAKQNKTPSISFLE